MGNRCPRHRRHRGAVLWASEREPRLSLTHLSRLMSHAVAQPPHGLPLRLVRPILRLGGLSEAQHTSSSSAIQATHSTPQLQGLHETASKDPSAPADLEKCFYSPVSGLFR